ncbi:MAG: glutathionylspermidine synthase family protein [Minwuia sp.]|uniref:glutathionylspermidine synthase family protein n=1 Tax=Minwuia sp. TaxID=2493630 RepID=UPI003A84B4D7
MQRIDIEARPDWRMTAEAHGFDFHSPNDTVYWEERACYAFSLTQIEDDLEAAVEAIEGFCFDVVDRVVSEPLLMRRLRIPEAFHGMIARSWKDGERNLYGRMDFAYDGSGPPRLLEYNADTPTALYEASVFQWVWLEQQLERGALPAGADQFNSLHERLVDALGGLGIDGMLYLASVADHAEDGGTVEYLADCARQAGLATERLNIEDIGLAADGRFVDLWDQPISWLFKLYPWEWLMAESFGAHIPGSGCRFIEPPWKAILSNKGLLPLLWEMFPDHPNLLPAWFADDPAAANLAASVRKPLLGREGANVEISAPGVEASKGGEYGAEGFIVQQYHPLPDFAGNRPVCGCWVVASEPAGLGVREDDGPITGDGARFVPHFIRP